MLVAIPAAYQVCAQGQCQNGQYTPRSLAGLAPMLCRQTGWVLKSGSSSLSSTGASCGSASSAGSAGPAVAVVVSSAGTGASSLAYTSAPVATLPNSSCVAPSKTLFDASTRSGCRVSCARREHAPPPPPTGCGCSREGERVPTRHVKERARLWRSLACAFADATAHACVSRANFRGRRTACCVTRNAVPTSPSSTPSSSNRESWALLAFLTLVAGCVSVIPLAEDLEGKGVVCFLCPPPRQGA